MEKISNSQRQQTTSQAQFSGSTQHIVNVQPTTSRAGDIAIQINQIPILSLFERCCIEWKDGFLGGISDFCNLHAIFAMRALTKVLCELITSFIFKRKAVSIFFEELQLYPNVQVGIQDKLNFAKLNTNIRVYTSVISLTNLASTLKFFPVDKLRISLKICSDQINHIRELLCHQSTKQFLAQVQEIFIDGPHCKNESLAFISENIKDWPYFTKLCLSFINENGYPLKLPEELKQLNELFIPSTYGPLEFPSNNNLTYLYIGHISCGFNLPSSLSNLRQLIIDEGEVDLSGSLNNLRELHIGGQQATFAPSLSLNNIESFGCTSLPKNIEDKLLCSLRNITSFTCASVNDEETCKFLCSLTNLKSLYIVGIGSISFKLPNTMNFLTHFSVDYKEPSVEQAFTNTYLGLPSALTCLSHLKIKSSIFNRATLELPDNLDNLLSLDIGDINNRVKFKLPGSDSAIYPLMQILPMLPNLTNLTIERIYHPVNYSDMLNPQYLSGKKVIKKHTINLTDSLINFVIGTIENTDVLIESQQPAKLEMLVIKKFQGAQSCILSDSLNKLSSLKIHLISANSSLFLMGSPTGLAHFTINLKYKCMVTIANSLPSLTTLIIEDNRVNSSDPNTHSLMGSLYIAAGALPNLTRLIIKEQPATLIRENGSKIFVMETENQAVKKLLDFINKQINK